MWQRWWSWWWCCGLVGVAVVSRPVSWCRSRQQHPTSNTRDTNPIRARTSNPRPLTSSPRPHPTHDRVDRTRGRPAGTRHLTDRPVPLNRIGKPAGWLPARPQTTPNGAVPDRTGAADPYRMDPGPNRRQAETGSGGPPTGPIPQATNRANHTGTGHPPDVRPGSATTGYFGSSATDTSKSKLVPSMLVMVSVTS